MAKDSVRLLHTSDLHLADGSEREAYVRVLVDQAVVEQVDLLVIAGDFFDHNAVSDRLVQTVARQLARLRVPILLLPGNHDCLVQGSALLRLRDCNSLPNLHVFENDAGEVVRYPHLDLSLWGKAHVGYGPDIFPLRGVPLRGAERWQVAVAHGHLETDTTPDTSAYLMTKSELAASARDYVALGHWERMTDVSTGGVPAWYCGSPLWQATAALVELSETVRIRPVPISVADGGVVLGV